MKKAFITILQGFWIGATMTVPGVSGGTMALIAGVYEELLHAVNHVREQPKRYLAFLLEFCVGAGVGFLSLARAVTFLLAQEVVGELLRFLFLGIVAGGIPLLVTKAEYGESEDHHSEHDNSQHDNSEHDNSQHDDPEYKKSEKLSISEGKGEPSEQPRHKTQGLRFVDVIALLSGAVIVGLISYFAGKRASNFHADAGFLIQFLYGIPVAIALILPGISVSHMLYLLGIYESVFARVYGFQWISLLPFIGGTIVGFLLCAEILEKLMRKYTRISYLVIIGFVAGSMVSLFPEDGIHYLLPDLYMAFKGFVFLYLLTRRITHVDIR